MMSEDAVLVMLAVSFLCFITFITFTFLEVQKTLHRIRLGIEKNGVLLTSVNEKLDGLATLNDKLGSVSENLFDISERFDAPGIARKKSDKRTQEIKALLDRLASDLPKTTRPIVYEHDARHALTLENLKSGQHPPLRQTALGS